MKKVLNFSSDGEKYILESTNPNETREPFTIDISRMEFNTSGFYEYVFSDINEGMDIEIVNLINDSEDKAAKRAYSTIVEICKGVLDKMNEKWRTKDG